MKKYVQFGAGNIGRSFLGQLFSRGGYEVVFVDIDQRIVGGLNRENAYRVIIKRSDQADETIWIRNVRAVDGRDAEAVAREVASADLIGTSVGQRALMAILPVIAKGLVLRRSQTLNYPLDIIIAENLRSAADFFRENLSKNLPADYPIDSQVGLVETSIGKMVPIMEAKDIEEDALWVFAEAYNNLILDAKGFKTPIPQIAGLSPKQNMPAYVDRKLFIHNLGHAAAAYFGYQKDPSKKYIWEVLEDSKVYERTKLCMEQSAQGLMKEWVGEFAKADLDEHIEDLLGRFRNKALGDTVFRVGRDLYRKLSREDRLIGSLRLAKKHGCECSEIAAATRAALTFRAADSNGEMFDTDREFVEKELPQGVIHILTRVLMSMIIPLISILEKQAN